MLDRGKIHFAQKSHRVKTKWMFIEGPPVCHQRARRDHLSRHNSVSQAENYLSYEQQQAIEEPQAFNPPNISHHILHPAGHSPQQNTVMVDIHDQIHAIPLGPITGHQREEINACPSASSHEEAVDYNEISPQSPLLQVEQTK
ncbi:E3 ubiquitin-protein ligase RNF38-like protein [Pitangus sulphuratus]|nr:E3 ubiquitin-protein ligase RNF38-like protein [Pitangus sulphuratus]